jgi:hypothetical protein
MSNAPDHARTREMMLRAAERCQQACQRQGLNLDFLPRTLPLVDRLISDVSKEVLQLVAKKDPKAKDVLMENTLLIAAYVGEVIVRATSGTWLKGPEEPMLHLGGDVGVMPLTVIQSFITRQPVEAEGGVRLETTKAFFESATRMQRQWADRMLLGVDQSMSRLRAAMSGDAKIAGAVVGLVQAAIVDGSVRYYQALDFSPASLDKVELILAAIHKYMKDAPADQIDPQSVDLICARFGAYLGEMIRRRYTGTWIAREDGVLELSIRNGAARMAPSAKVRKRLLNGDGDNVTFFVNALEGVLPPADA